MEPKVTINNWFVASDTLIGNVEDHPRFENGRFVRTSRIVNLDREGGLCETLDTIYILGDEYVCTTEDV